VARSRGVSKQGGVVRFVEAETSRFHRLWVKRGAAGWKFWCDGESMKKCLGVKERLVVRHHRKVLSVPSSQLEL
jgi:hypothetical protein